MSDLNVRRFVPAPRAAVWRAFAEADRFNAWFWPAHLAPLTVLDFRQGGAWRVSCDLDGMVVGGTYGEIRSADLIEFSWQWDGEPVVTEVTVRLDDDGDRGTIVTVEQRGFHDARRRAEHEQGWNDCLDRLPGACAR